ncbi:TonB-dependent receptor plug domain-containing protein [Ferrimonas pelagia]|uniref:TonB-dependent receptor n=1 Tax=Ferrimonas pelagia TaxID=1177826 RepID=A0ABP9EHN0_9GAMM
MIRPTALTLLLGLSTALSAAPERLQVLGQSLDQQLMSQAELGSSLIMIDAEQIASAGAVDINAILNQFVPGLFAQGKAGRYDGAYYALQGSRAKDILWLVDGNRINNRLYGSTYLDSINPMVIARIEVLKGGQGLVHGSDAIAGVVNIVTREPSADAGGQLQLTYDTLNSLGIGFSTGAQIGDVELLLFGSHDRSDGYELYRDEDVHWTAADHQQRGYHVNNVGAKLAYRPTNTQRLSLLAQHNQAELERTRPYGTLASHNRREQTLLTADWQVQLSAATALQTKAYYHQWDSFYFRLDQDDNGDLTLWDNDSFWGFKDHGIKLLASHQQADSTQWLAGLERQYFSGADEVMEFHSDNEAASAAFVQLQPRKLNNRLATSFGLRYDRLDDGEDQWTGSIGLHTPLLESQSTDLALRANLGTSYRLPTAEELHAVAKFGVIGNRDLRPEQGQNLNLGLEYQGSVYWQVELYWRRVEDLIGTVAIDDNLYQYQNLDGEIDSYGIDLSSRFDLSPRLSAELRGAWGQSETQGRQLDGVPQWTAQTRLHYRGERFELWWDQQGNGAFTDYGREAPSHWLTHLGASLWLDPLQQHRLLLRIENLFDQRGVQSIFNPGGTAPPDRRDPIDVLGAPRLAQLQYHYRF